MKRRKNEFLLLGFLLGLKSISCSPIGKMRKNGSQHKVKQPTTIASVLAAFCSLLNLANLLAKTPVEPDKLLTLVVEQYLHKSALLSRLLLLVQLFLEDAGFLALVAYMRLPLPVVVPPFAAAAVVATAAAATATDVAPSVAALTMSAAAVGSF